MKKADLLAPRPPFFLGALLLRCFALFTAVVLNLVVTIQLWDVYQRWESRNGGDVIDWPVTTQDWVNEIAPRVIPDIIFLLILWRCYLLHRWACFLTCVLSWVIAFIIMVVLPELDSMFQVCAILLFAFGALGVNGVLIKNWHDLKAGF